MLQLLRTRELLMTYLNKSYLESFINTSLTVYLMLPISQIELGVLPNPKA